MNKTKAKEALKLKKEGYSNYYIMNKLNLNYTNLIKHLKYQEQQEQQEKSNGN